LLKKEIRLMSLWLIMSFFKEKHNLERQTLMRTLRHLLLMLKLWVNIVQERWLGNPMISLPSSEEEEEMHWISDHGGFWINKML